MLEEIRRQPIVTVVLFVFRWIGSKRIGLKAKKDEKSKSSKAY